MEWRVEETLGERGHLPKKREKVHKFLISFQDIRAVVANWKEYAFPAKKLINWII